MTPDEARERLEALTCAAAHLENWHALVDVQLARARQKDVPALVTKLDSYQFAHALWLNYQAARFLSNKHLDGRLRSSLRQFEREVPDWEDIRHVIEHFDAYERGEGNLQNEGRLKKIPPFAGDYFAVAFQHDQGEITLFIGGELSLQVAAANAAAHRLFEAAQTEIAARIDRLTAQIDADS